MRIRIFKACKSEQVARKLKFFEATVFLTQYTTHHTQPHREYIHKHNTLHTRNTQVTQSQKQLIIFLKNNVYMHKQKF